MRNGLSKIKCLMCVLLMVALAGCGANTATTTAVPDSKATTAKAKLVLPKATAKSAALAGDNVTKIRLMLTGKAIPTAKKDFTGDLTQAMSIDAYPGANLIFTAYAYDTNGALVYEGFTPNVTVVSGVDNDEVIINLNPPVIKATDANCLTCHQETRDTDDQNLIANYKQSGHYKNDSATFPLVNGATQAGCAGCHGTQHNVLNPATSGRCFTCHALGGTAAGINANHPVYTGGLTNTCGGCHVTHLYKGKSGCIGCHSIGQNSNTGFNVNDNNGVRAITGEFEKRSHHVTGREVKNSDCAVCHLEGMRNGTSVSVDPAYHMKDDRTYLRNGNTTLTLNQTTSFGAGYAWDPAAPNHTLMDQFCFSCHNAGGAPNAAAAISGVAGYTGTALNPFGDSVSNAYDQVSRVNVVNAFDQFDTGNSSHHAVRGKKYNSNTLSAATFTNISTNNYNLTLAGVAAPVKGIKNYIGTMTSLGKFTTTYTTLNNVALADNATLHCGDCHTVGQFRAADVNLAVGSFNKAVIGAHGSGNEYLLRNSNGDDTLAKDALVCYICHNYNEYGSAAPTGVNALGVTITAHNNANSSSGHCNNESWNTAGLDGLARLTFTDAKSANVVSGKYGGAGGGNIFGIKCANCHNSSDKKTFGGIHGNAGNASYNTYSGAKTASAPTYVVSRKPYRFMPGLGNFRYNGGDNTNDWTVKTVSSSNKQSCYTLNGSSTSTSRTAALNAGTNINAVTQGTDVDGNKYTDNGLLGSWGACTDHAGTSIRGGDHDPGRTLLRPLTY